MDRSGLPRYNMAVRLLHRESAQDALAQLDQATEQAASAAGTDASPDSAKAARIQTPRGRCKEAIGNLAGARRAVLLSHALDPREMEAAFELSKLEGQGGE